MRISLLFGLLLIYSACNPKEQSYPNIVWLTTEDNSPHHMKLYNQNGAAMPAIEKLAKEGIIFDNAFSNAPVCSVARSTLITVAMPQNFHSVPPKSPNVTLPKANAIPYLREVG